MPIEIINPLLSILTNAKCTPSSVFFSRLGAARYIFLYLLFLNFSALKYGRSVDDRH